MEQHTKEKYRTLVISDIHIYREGILHDLSRRPELELFGFSSSSPIEHHMLRAADIVLLDISFPDIFSIMETMSSSERSDKLVILDLVDRPDSTVQCLKMGARAFISKTDSIDELYRCIQTLESGKTYLSSHLNDILLQQFSEQSSNEHRAAHFEKLTMRQLKVLELIETGFSNKEIAKSLDIELNTVKNHVHAILEKLEVRSRCEAGALLRRHHQSLMAHDF